MMSALPMSKRYKQQEGKRDKAASTREYEAEGTYSGKTHTSPTSAIIVPLFDDNICQTVSGIFTNDATADAVGLGSGPPSTWRVHSPYLGLFRKDRIISQPTTASMPHQPNKRTTAAIFVS